MILVVNWNLRPHFMNLVSQHTMPAGKCFFCVVVKFELCSLVTLGGGGDRFIAGEFAFCHRIEVLYRAVFFSHVLDKSGNGVRIARCTIRVVRLIRQANAVDCAGIRIILHPVDDRRNIGLHQFN